MSDAVPSKSSYSRLVTQLSESNVLNEVKERLILKAIQEGFITDDTVAIDVTHFEARDKAPTKKREAEG